MKRFIKIVKEIVGIVFITFVLWTIDTSKLMAKLNGPILFDKNNVSFTILILLIGGFICLIGVTIFKITYKTEFVEELVGLFILIVMYGLLARTKVPFSTFMISVLLPICCAIAGIDYVISNLHNDEDEEQD